MNSISILIEKDITPEQCAKVTRRVETYVGEGYDEIVLDFRYLLMINSAGVGLLIQVLNILKGTKCALRIKHVSDNVLEALRILRFHNQIDITT